MTALKLMETLRLSGASFLLVDGEPRIKAPSGLLTPEMVSSLRTHREAIGALLTSHPCGSCGRFAFPTSGITCYWCRRTDAVERTAA